MDDNLANMLDPRSKNDIDDNVQEKGMSINDYNLKSKSLRDAICFHWCDRLEVVQICLNNLSQWFNLELPSQLETHHLHSLT